MRVFLLGDKPLVFPGGDLCLLLESLKFHCIHLPGKATLRVKISVYTFLPALGSAIFSKSTRFQGRPLLR